MTPVPSNRPPTPFPWASRWSFLCRGIGMDPQAPVVIALSGGADSVLLLHLAARSRPTPTILAVHVEHALRGEESSADAEFCQQLCDELGVQLVRRQAPINPDAPNLEAQAREARYAALCDAARQAGIGTLATAHHRDDQLETLLMRWLRGSDMAGLAGLRAVTQRRAAGFDLRVARPLIALRSGEVRALLKSEGIAWRDDSSNQDTRFTRNRVRTQLVPALAAKRPEATSSDPTLDHLLRFAAAVEGLEDDLAKRTAHITWRTPAWATACHSREDTVAGGTLEREALSRLPRALQRRALWRLLLEGTGQAASRALIDLLMTDLEAGRTTSRTLPGGTRLMLRRNLLHLVPQAPAQRVTPQPSLPFPRFEELTPAALRLGLPGLATLPDGRAIEAEIVSVAAAQPVPLRPDEVELDPGQDWSEAGSLTVRWARPGDRFHGLGAPGSRPLGRFLADAGIPREERGRIPLVFAGSELIWVAGLRPSESRRVRAGTRRRLRLRLLGAASAPLPPRRRGEGDLFGDVS